MLRAHFAKINWDVPVSHVQKCGDFAWFWDHNIFGGGRVSFSRVSYITESTFATFTPLNQNFAGSWQVDKKQEHR